MASKEYAEVVDWSMLPVPLIETRFLEQRGEKLKVIAIHAKRARGMMARFVLEEGIEEPAQLSTFGEGGYAYAPELSEEGKPCFVR
ncbi:MAG: peroxide stress protein YaaA [Myxococcota bacterium]|nr:peroxide stress protein YaaA [Myxococcota bacterium]